MTKADLHTHWIASSGREGGSGASQVRFPYWSFTKTVIAICALNLAESGALDLDAPLAGEPYSLRHLLAHTSGLPDYAQLAEYHRAVSRGEPPWSRDALLDRVMRNGPLFRPGVGWSYSNVGYMRAREEIERATGKPLKDLVSDLICAPLGLESVRLAETEAQFASLHWTAAGDYDPGWVYHGCLTGTAADAARLLHALCSGHLLSPEARAQMLQERPVGGALPGRPWTRCGYGLGLMRGEMQRVGAAIGHSGSGPFSVNAVYHFPEAPEPVTVACFTDGTDPGVAEFEAVTIAEGI
ncbi:serine hydrolase domain-containing protein [Thioclava atlantica]|uniref:Beta-lactamase n=1 Tax=Thioclava atlantica TaxID=1317124 RepID=A0A085TW84_9RHOB|nr:serine hydrolase domain-containing protein [Thioclava atlantica]KFE34981.1 beta-lactamase [Thioclava atlantica]